MAKLLFRLNDVPLDEAIAVRQLLDEHDYSFYETHAGLFGFAVAGIWLHDEGEFPQARALLNEFAQARSKELKDAVALDGSTSFWQFLQQRPLAIVLSIFSVLVVLGLSVWPFINFANF